MIDREKLRLLEDHHLQMIHETSCRLLEECGIYFEVDEAFDIADQAKLPFDRDSRIIYFPRRVIEDAIHSTPDHFKRKGSSPRYDLNIGGGQLYLGAGSLPIYVLDPNSGSRRKALYRDMLCFLRLVNECDNLSIGNAVIKPSDVPDPVVHAVFNQVTVKYTEKPACCWYADRYQTARDTLRILEAAAGGREALKEAKTWALTSCPDACLKWGYSMIGLIEMARAGVPVEIMDTPFPGSLSPVTIAGTVALSNANVLAGVALAQIINPGTPLVYCFYGGTMDMKVAGHAFGTPENALYTAAASQLCNMYHIPCNMTTPAVSAKCPDAQYACEKMMTAILPALSGVDCLSLFGGILDFGLTASYEQMLIDNEMAGQILHIRKGFEVTPETLAYDVIKSAGHGGHFLETDHTLKHYKNELYIPQLADRYGYEIWKKQGSKNILKNAKDKVEEILIDSEPECFLSVERCFEVDRAVNEILQRENVEPAWLED